VERSFWGGGKWAECEIATRASAGNFPRRHLRHAIAIRLPALIEGRSRPACTKPKKSAPRIMSGNPWAFERWRQARIPWTMPRSRPSLGLAGNVYCLVPVNLENAAFCKIGRAKNDPEARCARSTRVRQATSCGTSGMSSRSTIISASSEGREICVARRVAPRADDLPLL
jgi:hypothetical protein